MAKNNPLIGIEKATKQICLGSDYDGLINAIDNCKQVDQLGDFKKLAINKMQGLLDKADLGSEGIDVNELVENIFYKNGKNFILKRLQEINQ